MSMEHSSPNEQERRAHWFKEHFRHPLWSNKCNFCQKVIAWNRDKLHDHVIRHHFDHLGLKVDDPLVHVRTTAFQQFRKRFKPNNADEDDPA